MNGLAYLKGTDGQLRELALFAGAGGGILGSKLLGWRTVCAVEWEPYPAAVLAQRQNDGILAPFPIWDDVRTFDGRPWRGIVDVVSGGFPCQDISIAGRGAGLDGERSGLWSEMARIIGEVGPRKVLVENSSKLTSRGLGRVLRDLARLGYDARWGVLGGFSAGMDVDGKRIWILAHEADGKRGHSRQVLRRTVHPKEPSRRQYERAIGSALSQEAYAAYIGNPDGLARWMDEFRAAGNGQVPELARLAVETLG